MKNTKDKMKETVLKIILEPKKKDMILPLVKKNERKMIEIVKKILRHLKNMISEESKNIVITKIIIKTTNTKTKEIIRKF